MKNTDGQLYTIEGFAAALIMIATAYLVINATSVYTAGDTHISDMQLEALGSDALMMMGTPTDTTMYLSNISPLEEIVKTDDGGKFKATFLNLTNTRFGSVDYNEVNSTMDYIQFNASYSCRIQDDNPLINNTIARFQLSNSRNLTGGEHTVKATKWVIVDKPASVISPFCGSTSQQDRAVLVEVLLWRD